MPHKFHLYLIFNKINSSFLISEQEATTPSPQQMICEDDDNTSEPEMVSHEDVQPEVTSHVAQPEVSSSKHVAQPEVTPQQKTEMTPENLAEDLSSKARLTDEEEEKEEKAVKRNEVATPQKEKVVAPVPHPPTVTSPKPSR